MEKLQSLLNTLTRSNTTFIFVILILIFLSVLLFYMIYTQNKKLIEEMKKKKEVPIKETEESIISLEEVLPKSPETENNAFDLESVTKELELLPKEPKTIELTSYEMEQEEKAIISYDELVEKSGMASISYSDERKEDNILVKKVDLENTGKIELDPIKKEINSKVPLLSYEHEEAFLNALKQLQELIN